MAISPSSGTSRHVARLPSTDQGFAQSLRCLQPGRLVEGVDLGAALAVGASLAEVVGYGITAIFLTIYLLSDRERLQGALTRSSRGASTCGPRGW